MQGRQLFCNEVVIGVDMRKIGKSVGGGDRKPDSVVQARVKKAPFAVLESRRKPSR
jgi:hypothetical protein